MREHAQTRSAAAGFSLVELMIAMTITLVVMSLASGLLAASLNSRIRENNRSDALADAQRALNSMSREIANSGFGLSTNGIVAADSDLSSIRVRANLNAFDKQTSSNAVNDSDEDVKYMLFQGGGGSYVLRLDVNTGARTTVLANTVDALRIRYFAQRVAYTPANCDITLPAGTTEVAQKSAARYVVITTCVNLPARGTPNGPGYQPPSVVQLTSDVALRNSDLNQY
jgi:prepilin-type N-terminal cleavage/methylation domain-containing protein